MSKNVEIYFNSHELRERFMVWFEEEGGTHFEDWLLNYTDTNEIEIDVEDFDQFIIRIEE